MQKFYAKRKLIPVNIYKILKMKNSKMTENFEKCGRKNNCGSQFFLSITLPESFSKIGKSIKRRHDWVIKH